MKRKKWKIIFWIFVVCFIIFSIYQGYRAFKMTEYFGEKMKDVEKYLDAEVYKINSSLRIVTLGIVRGYPCEPGEIKWVLKPEGKDTEIDLSAIEKNQEDFTDENLFDDSKYQIYWYDADNDGSIYIGDYLKVKLPEKGEYILQGKIEFGKTKSGETVYTPIFGEKINLSSES